MLTAGVVEIVQKFLWLRQRPFLCFGAHKCSFLMLFYTSFLASICSQPFFQLSACPQHSFTQILCKSRVFLFRFGWAIPKTFIYNIPAVLPLFGCAQAPKVMTLWLWPQVLLHGWVLSRGGTTNLTSLVLYRGRRKRRNILEPCSLKLKNQLMSLDMYEAFSLSCKSGKYTDISVSLNRMDKSSLSIVSRLLGLCCLFLAWFCMES